MTKIRINAGQQEPVVELSRIGKIQTLEVTVDEIKQVRSGAITASFSFALFTLFLGMLVPTLIAWRTSSPTGDGLAVYVGASVGLGGLTLGTLIAFIVSTVRAKSTYDSLMTRVRVVPDPAVAVARS